MIIPTVLLSPKIGAPVGSQREGLHSVFKRTCEKNQLTVNDVFSNLVLPMFGTHPVSATKMNADVHLINRGCSTTDRLISGFRELASLPELIGYTLRELAELRGIGAIAIAHDRKWCSACYETSLATELGPYDHLIWSLDDVQICPIHKVHLQNICPSCGAGPFRVLTGRDISGFCPECQGWLGGRSAVLAENRDEYTQFLFWVSKSYADLLDSPLPSKLDVGASISLVLRALAEKHFDGAYAPLARAVERNKSVICTWLKGNGAPSWRALIEISFAFQIPLSEFFQGQLDAVSISSIRPLPLAVVKRLTEPRKLPEKRDLDAVKSYLASVENGTIPNLTTLRSVASRININARELRRIAPIETAQISKVLAGRRKLSMQRKHEGREKLLRDEIPKALTKLLDDGLQPTRRTLHKSLTDIGISIRREEGPQVSEIVQQFFVLRNTQNISGNM